jgi:hypothetical protein
MHFRDKHPDRFTAPTLRVLAKPSSSPLPYQWVHSDPLLQANILGKSSTGPPT